MKVDKKCEVCKKDFIIYFWANKSREYQRNLADWLQLYVPCHKAYDRNLVHSN